MAATTSTSHVQQVFVHPVALFAIVDSYERRNEDSKRVVGTLLGTVTNEGVVEIKNCFTVPHVETQEEVAFDKEYASSMKELYKSASPAEEVVGWFATSNEVTGHSTLIHEYYSIECKSPVHLTVDTQLKTGRMTVKAYVSSPIGVPGGTIGTIFTPVPCTHRFYETEIVAVKTFAKTKGGSKSSAPLLNSVEHISKSANSLMERLNSTLDYVNKVLSGETVADNEIGQKLMAVVGSAPQMQPAQVEKMMNNNMQDLLMVLYLSSLMKTQLAFGTKLNHIIYKHSNHGRFTSYAQFA